MKLFYDNYEVCFFIAPSSVNGKHVDIAKFYNTFSDKKFEDLEELQQTYINEFGDYNDDCFCYRDPYLVAADQLESEINSGEISDGQYVTLVLVKPIANIQN